MDGDRAVRHVAPLVVPGMARRPGHLDVSPRALAVAEDVGAGRIGDSQAVYVELAIVDARRDRPHGHAPHAVGVLGHGLRADRFADHGDLFGLGGPQAEGDLAVRLHFRRDQRPARPGGAAFFSGGADRAVPPDSKIRTVTSAPATDPARLLCMVLSPCIVHVSGCALAGISHRIALSGTPAASARCSAGCHTSGKRS